MATLTFNPIRNQNTLSIEALEAILVPGGQTQAESLNRRSLLEYLSHESPTIDTSHTCQIFRDFGDSRVAVVLDKHTRMIRVHWLNAGPNLQMSNTTWDYAMDRPEGVWNRSLSYVGL